jgi:hypothetical protein
LKIEKAGAGSVTLIQRFGSAANLNIPLRCLVLDGISNRDHFMHIDEAPDDHDPPRL